MKKLFLLVIIFYVSAPMAAVAAASDDQIVTSLDKILLHHPAEIIGFEWHDIPVENADRTIASVYHEFGLQPIWVSAEGPSAQAQAVHDVIVAAADEGLIPNDYQADVISRTWDSRTATDLATLEVALTVGLITYLSDVRHGRVQPQKPDEAIFYSARDKEIDPYELITEALAAPDMAEFLAAQLPSHPAYTLTRDALRRYRTLPDAPGSTIPDGAVLHPGETDPRLPAIRNRLANTGDLNVAGGKDNRYDETSVAAVKRFQARHGLDEDGIIGKGTLAAMNVSLATRIRQLEMNLERWRWMAHDLGERYVIVDIPAYTAVSINDDNVVARMRVIVGRYHHETPVFSDTIKYVVINPYWTLTTGIARNETLPKLQQNPNYLEEKHISLFRGWSDDEEIDPHTIDWDQVTKKQMNQYRLRQNPGPWNSLGTLKIIFPNDYSVYLHDTPNHDLFDLSKRAFSHGCIRMSEPHQQAAFVLDGAETGWTVDRIGEVVAEGERTVVPLETPMLVHLTYTTAWAGEDGTVHFVTDLYGRDDRLAKALYGS